MLMGSQNVTVNIYRDIVNVYKPKQTTLKRSQILWNIRLGILISVLQRYEIMYNNNIKDKLIYNGHRSK